MSRFRARRSGCVRTVTPTPRAPLATGSLSGWPTRASFRRANSCRGAERAGPDAPAGSAVSRAASGARAARCRTGRRASSAPASIRCCSAGSKPCCAAKLSRSTRSATLAAMVVDNRERRVVAHVGNAVFGAPARRGTIDMTTGGALAGLGAEAFYLCDGVRPADPPPGNDDRGPQALFRRRIRLRAERFRRKISRARSAPARPCNIR